MFQDLLHVITTFITVVIVTISTLPGAILHINKPVNTSVATSSATISESPLPSASPTTKSPPGEKQIPKKIPSSSTTPSPSPQKTDSAIHDKIWELQNELQKNNQSKKQSAESSTPTPTPQLIQISKPTQMPTPTPVEVSQNGITSLSFKTYWKGEIVFDYFVTVCFPTNQEVVWGKIYLVNSSGRENLVSNTDFRNPPCAQTGGIGLSLKANGFNELGTYTLKVVIDNPPQIKTATSTIGPPQ